MSDADLERLRMLTTAASDPSTCPSAEVLARAATGDASAGERRAIADHLATCPSCSEEYRVATALGGWARSTSRDLGEPPVRGRAALGAPARTLAYAAAALLVVGLTTALAMWGLSLRAENARLATALRNAAPTTPSADPKSSDAPLSATIAELQARLTDAQAPSLNVPIVDLLPPEVLRGSSRATAPRVPAGVGEVTFVLTTARDPAARDHELEIVGPSGNTLWRGGGLRPNAERTFTVTVPRALLPAGTCRLRLYASQSGASQSSGPRLVADYPVRVEP